ncbi:hypothetical protein DYBT9275_02766 [Dyadobacter sp. CECT 9275]|uniref:Uncharacterized protein n=1 Tax=Dyadobacter helix TaxID=2822344 RepID=A0A916NLN2_9BACT|nr:hypothetical protein DYBT9275_02766 [Dyadobacter sp. CECT 9275]
MSQKKQTMLVIQHTSSTHKQDISEAEFNKLRPEIKSKYKILERSEVKTPAEISPIDN